MTFSLKNVAKKGSDDPIFRSHIHLLLRNLILIFGMTTVAHAQIVILNSGYDVIALEDASISLGSEVSGRIAAGGDVSISWFSTVGVTSNDSLPVVYAGQDLTIVGSSISNGNAVFGNQSLLLLDFYDQGYGAYKVDSTHSAPFSTNHVKQHFTGLSSALSNLGTTGSMDLKKGRLTLKGNTGFNVFNIDLSHYTGVTDFKIQAPRNATIVINIYGDSFNFIDGALSGAQSSNILFNFVDTTSIDFSGADVSGSILAPYATITGSGRLDGQLVGFNINVNNWETSGNSFTGNIPASAIPEPGTYALLLGLASTGSLAFQRRRRRQKTQLAKTKAGVTAR